MAQSVFGSGGNFQRLVQSVLPLVVKQLQESGAPAPSVLPLSTAFENPLMGASLSSSQADFGVPGRRVRSSTAETGSQVYARGYATATG